MWQEGQTLAQIDDVNVVKVFDLFEASTAGGRTLAMTMELMTGGDLRDRVNRGAIPWREACALVTGVLSGLAAIHEAGLVHRDVKPGNVLIAKNGTPKVTDLGIARDMSGRMQTRTGQAIGTSAYMSPEQVKGEKVDARTDVYAVGLLLYELIVGVSPYEGVPNDYRLLAAQAEQVVDLSPVAATGAGAIVEVLGQALSKDAAARPSSAAAFRRTLAGALNGDGARQRPQAPASSRPAVAPPVMPVTPQPMTQPAAKTSSGLKWGVGAGLVALLMLGAIMTTEQRVMTDYVMAGEQSRTDEAGMVFIRKCQKRPSGIS